MSNINLNDLPTSNGIPKGLGFCKTASGKIALDDGSSVSYLSPSKIVRNTICIIGDSFVSRDEHAATFDDPTGAWGHTNALLGQKMDVLNIDGVGGTGAIQTPTYASRLSASVLAFAPAYCAVQVSINDFNNTNTYAQLVTAYSAVFQTLNVAGIKIITNTCPPSDAITTSAQRKIWLQFNQWLQTTATGLFDMIVINESYQNRTAGGVVTDADLTYTDGTHPLTNGAIKIAASRAAVLASEFTNSELIDRIMPSLTGTDAMALVVNPFRDGLGGTFVNGSNTGVVADSMEGGALNGTGVWSLVPRDDHPSNWQKVVWTPLIANQYCQFAIPFASRSQALNAGCQVGDTIQYLWEMFIPADTAIADVGVPSFQIKFDGPSTVFDVYQLNGADLGLQKNNIRLVYASPKLTIPAGTTGISSINRVRNKTTNAQTYYFGREGIINYSR